MKFIYKITLSMFCLFSLLFGLGGSLIISCSFNTSLENEKKYAYNSYQNTMTTLQLVNEMKSRLTYNDILNTMEQLSNQNNKSQLAVRIYTNNGTIYSNGQIHLVERNTSDVRTDKCNIKYLYENDNSSYILATGAMKSDSELIFMDIAYDTSFLNASLTSQKKVYYVVFLIVSILCAVISYVLSKIITKPLSELSKTSKAISSGDLSKRVNIKTNDEIGVVANDFNLMVDALKNNIEQREQFIGAFAHEVKTPMTSIIGYADLIRQEMLNKDEEIDAANYIVTESKRLESLSQKLMEFLVIKNKEVKLSYASPSKIIKELECHLEAFYKTQSIKLTCDCEDGECYIEPELMKSMIINLWDNARKAIETSNGKIHTKLTMTEKGCRICVSDNGKGIDEKKSKHFTETFYRADKSRSRKQGGAGIGLALCNEIIKLHHGSIQFENSSKKGTNVTVELNGGRLC